MFKILPEFFLEKMKEKLLVKQYGDVIDRYVPPNVGIPPKQNELWQFGVIMMQLCFPNNKIEEKKLKVEDIRELFSKTMYSSDLKDILINAIINEKKYKSLSDLMNEIEFVISSSKSSEEDLIFEMRSENLYNSLIKKGNIDNVIDTVIFKESLENTNKSSSVKSEVQYSGSLSKNPLTVLLDDIFTQLVDKISSPNVVIEMIKVINAFRQNNDNKTVLLLNNINFACFDELFLNYIVMLLGYTLELEVINLTRNTHLSLRLQSW